MYYLYILHLLTKCVMLYILVMVKSYLKMTLPTFLILSI